MKEVRTQDAVGQVLCHDITRIVKGVVKDAAFRKGHVITEEDIPKLLDLGKDHVFIWENDETMMHENDAADVLRSICQGSNMHPTPVKEGKIELVSDIDGLFMADVEALRRINSLGNMMIATIPSGFRVSKGQRLAGTRVIPLVIKKEEMEQAKKCAEEKPLLEVMPFRPRRYGVVTTGNEVFSGRIADSFTPTIVDKMAEFGCIMVRHETTDDDNNHIEAAIGKMVADSDVEMIICTGGMSVDPDDRTPLAIRNSGANIVSYGAPVLPGAMFLMGYLPDGRPICGLPGCVMYSKRTIFDLVLPRIMADVPVTSKYLAGLGHGGFCQNCSECRFPNCSFGKGV
ncbi:MAG: molybdopterin-binding protein [Spirochaetales bacterium]|nr:molybdopterin-binding protein [Spirochaetales bacterium]